jgi:hypothetical protein
MHFLKNFFESRFFSIFLTIEPSQEPSFLSQMMIGSSCSLSLSIVPHRASPATPKSKRDWKDDSTALLMDLFKFLANSMNSFTQRQWQILILRIEVFPLTPPHTWAQVQSVVHKTWKKIYEFKQEHGESGPGQCKWATV